jgi:uncharacterized membrane protein YbhN (UPF0104 family)
MLVFFITAAFVALPGVMVDIAQAITVVLVLCALFLGLVMFRKHHAHAVCANNRWSAHLKVLVEDLHLMGNAKTFYAAAAASLPYLLIQVVPVYGMMKAYGLELGIWPALVVLMLLRIGTVVPQAPGNVGTAQAVIVLGLAIFAVDKTTATGLAFMTWAVITFPLLVVGFFALALTGFGLGDLTSRARAHMSAPPVIATADTSGK